MSRSDALLMVAILALVWGFLAFRAFSRGDTKFAVAYLVIGAAFLLYRLLRLRNRTR